MRALPPLLRRLPGRALVVLGLSSFYSASGLSNYLMAIIGTEQVLRDVWAGNVPTPHHETIGLIFITDAFSRATGMMLLGMGLYKTGYLKDPSRALKHQPLALGAILAGGLASALGLLWAHQHDYNVTSILIGNISNTVGTIPMSLGYLVFLMTWDHRGTSRILDPLRRLGQRCPHQLSWPDHRMSHTRKHFTEGIIIAFSLASDGPGALAGTGKSIEHLAISLHTAPLNGYGGRSATYRRLEPSDAPS